MSAYVCAAECVCCLCADDYAEPGWISHQVKRDRGPILTTAWSEARVSLLHGKYKAPPRSHAISPPTADEPLRLSTTVSVAAGTICTIAS